MPQIEDSPYRLNRQARRVAAPHQLWLLDRGVLEAEAIVCLARAGARCRGGGAHHWEITGKKVKKIEHTESQKQRR